jgi:hypothetical protein
MTNATPPPALIQGAKSACVRYLDKLPSDLRGDAWDYSRGDGFAVVVQCGKLHGKTVVHVRDILRRPKGGVH